MKAFPITYWYGIRPEFLCKERIEEAIACGFNVIECCYDPEDNFRVLKWCDELGVRAIVSDGRIYAALNQSEGWQDSLRAMMDDYREYSSLLYYHLKDEPTEPQFALLRTIAEFMKEYDPAHPAYINLLPVPALANAENYAHYVRAFMETVHPAILSYDHYSFQKKEVEALTDMPEAIVSPECRERNHTEGVLYEKYNRPAVFDNLEICRSLSEEFQTPFMSIILAVEHWDYRLLNEAELRWEAFNCMAYGISMLSYFTYWTPGVNHDEPWSYHHGIINADGSRDAHYDMVRSINAELAVIGPMLLERKSTGVFHVGPEVDQVVPFEAFNGIDAIEARTLTAGFFDDDILLIVNKDIESAQTVRIRTGKALSILNKKTLTRTELFPSAGGVYTVELAAGDGAMLHIK